jgi:hypothetical protein
MARLTSLAVSSFIRKHLLDSNLQLKPTYLPIKWIWYEIVGIPVIFPGFWSELLKLGKIPLELIEMSISQKFLPFSVFLVYN